MKKLVMLLTILVMLPKWSVAFNLITDIRENVEWTFGQAATAGEGWNFTTNSWDASALAEVFQYRFLSFSYGGTQVDSGSSKATDTFKLGFLSNFFFNWFVNKPTPQMAWMENLNVGPSYAIPIFSGQTKHQGTFLLDLNYRFGQ